LTDTESSPSYFNRAERARLLQHAFDVTRVDECLSLLSDLVEHYPSSDKAPVALADAARIIYDCRRDAAKAGALYQRVVEGWPDTYARFLAEVGLIGLTFDREDFAAVREQIDACDRALEEHADQPWALQATLDLAMEVRHHSLFPTRSQFRQEGIARFQDIADNYPGTPQASDALSLLVSHYTFDEPDLERAQELNARLFKESPSLNAKRCAVNIRRMFAIGTRYNEANGDYYLIQIRVPEVRERAQRVVRRYRKLSNSRMRRFVREATTLQRSPETEKVLGKVMTHARATEDQALLRDAILLQGECYFIKWQPEKAIAWYSSIENDDSALLSEEDLLRVRDYHAMSLFWSGRYREALAAFELLATDAPEPGNADLGAPHTKASYAYMRALTLLLMGDLEPALAQYRLVCSAYPNTPWAERSRFYIQAAEQLLKAVASVDGRLGMPTRTRLLATSGGTQ
jgi:TolA-binding protein